MRETSRWTALLTSRGGGYPVQQIEATTTNSTGGGGVGWRGEIKKSRKLVETGRAVRLE